ncbi:hypothetical protein ERO13_D06G084550v2, partial [Gossypium hirsutum]
PNIMKLLCWNVCGLGNPRFVRKIQYWLKENRPHVIFLFETKLDARKMEKIRRKFGYGNGIDVPSVGTRSGLSFT